MAGLTGLETFLDQPNLTAALYERYREVIQEESGREGGKVIYDGQYIKIIHPVTREGACYYGRGTRWCTAATVADNMFEHYNQQGPMYIIQPKNPDKGGKEKYQLHFESGQFMDEKDDPINLNELVEKYPEIKILKENGYIQNFDSSLLFAADNINDINAIRSLLDNNIDIDIKNRDGDTILCRTIKNYDYDKSYYENLLNFLLEKGANPNITCKYEELPLFIATDKMKMIILQSFFWIMGQILI